MNGVRNANLIGWMYFRRPKGLLLQQEMWPLHLLKAKVPQIQNILYGLGKMTRVDFPEWAASPWPPLGTVFENLVTYADILSTIIIQHNALPQNQSGPQTSCYKTLWMRLLTPCRYPVSASLSALSSTKYWVQVFVNILARASDHIAHELLVILNLSILRISMLV